MLSNIKRGRKKKQKSADEKPPQNDSNAAAADLLRQSLASGKTPSTATAPTSVWSRLESQGRLPTSMAGNTAIIPVSAVPTTTFTSESEMTPAQLALLEKQQPGMSESLAREAIRTGKHKRKVDNVDSDNDDNDITAMNTKLDNEKLFQKSQKRLQAQQAARYDHQSQALKHLSWWISAPTFAKHRLLALGQSVSLSIMPMSHSLIVGKHFSIVPVPHFSCMAAASSEVRQEVAAFLTALRATFADDSIVLAWETVKSSSSSMTQAQWQAVAVPSGHEVELYFQSALTAQAKEDSANPNVIKISKTAGKSWYTYLPTKGDYFYIDFGDLAMALILESDNKFPKSFAIDTIANMLDEEPLRMRRPRNVSISDEMKHINSFLEKFKPYDWTLDLR